LWIADGDVRVDSKSEGERFVRPECEGRLRRDEAQGETVHTDCGLVVGEGEIDHGPEWRAFDAGKCDRKRRTGAPMTQTRHDKGLSSRIGWRDTDIHGTPLNPRQRRRTSRLRTWDERFRTSDPKERTLGQALGEIDRMASALGLPANVRETASVIYRRALDEDLLPGRSIESVATASLYAAARGANTPRTIDEVAAVSRIDETEFTRAYRYIVRELRPEIEPTAPERYLPRFATELGLENETERRAYRLLQAGKAAGLYSGRRPVGLAAAAIYAGTLGTNETVTRKAVGAVAKVSDVTIRNRYRELLEADRIESNPSRGAV